MEGFATIWILETVHSVKPPNAHEVASIALTPLHRCSSSMRACREAAVRRCRELAQGKYTGKKYELSSNLHIKDNKGDKSRDKQQAVAFVEAASNDCNSTVLGIDCIICDHLWYSDVAPASQAYEY